MFLFLFGSLRQVCEKYLANGKDVFCDFMYLEKAYDTIGRHGMYVADTEIRVYGVGGKLLKSVQSFHADSRACVRVGNDVRGATPLHPTDAVGVNLKKGATTENQGAGVKDMSQVVMLDDFVCVV